MSNNPTDSRRHFVPEWAEAKDKSRAEIIEFTGADKSIVSRWYAGALPQPRYLNMLAKFFAIDVSDLFRDPSEGVQHKIFPVELPELSSEDVAHISANGDHGDTLPYGGIVEAGTFRPVELISQTGERRRINVPPVGKFGQARQAAYEIRGDSMDLRGLHEGMWAIGINVIDYAEIYGRSVQDEQLVVVRRTRFQGSEIEMTVKEVRLFKDRTELIPRSRNSAHKKLIIPAVMDGESDENIEIAAIVAWAGWSFL